jgi:uncharacterized iron-regulated membrane protein
LDPAAAAEARGVNSTRAMFKVHSWMGLVSGVFMLVVVLSGVYLVYRAELDRFFNPQIRYRPATAHPVSIDTVLRAARAAYPQYHMGYLMFPGDAHAPFVAFLREGGADGEVIRHQVYIDAGTGRVVGHRLSYHFLSDWMVRVHEGLWLPDFWGEPLVAVLGIVLALLGLTGLWVYRHKIGEALRWRKTTERLGRSHAHFGVWSLLFAIVLGVTGTVLNWRSLVVFVHAAPKVPLQGVPWRFLDRVPSMDALVARSHAAFPQLDARYIYFPLSGTSNETTNLIKVSGRTPGARLLGATSYVTFFASPSAPVAGTYDARSAPLGRKLLYLTNTVHYGDFGGNVSKAIYVLGGLVLTFLGVSGLWLRLRPRRFPSRIQPKRNEDPSCPPSPRPGGRGRSAAAASRHSDAG